MPPPLNILSDTDLARRAQTAPRPEALDCFDQIVRRYQVPLRHFLTRRFPSRTDADDLVQESFLKAWQSLHRYDPNRGPASLRIWLYTIAYRTAVSQGRRDHDTRPLPPALHAHAPSPHDHAQQHDDRLSLWQHAREVLSDDQFTALWLHYVADLPARDIARILNRSWVNVKTIMHRARKKLEPFLREPPPLPLHVRIPVAAPVALKAGET